MISERQAIEAADHHLSLRPPGPYPLRFHSAQLFQRGRIARAIDLPIWIVRYEWVLPPNQSIEHTVMIKVNAETGDVVTWRDPRLGHA